MSFHALEAGTLVVQWYEVPAGAHISKKAKPKPILVASGKLSFTGAGMGTLHLRLTGAGRKLLKHASRLKLTAEATFTPSGKAAVTTTRTFSIVKGK
jgi:hypothetical protein